MWIEKIVLKNWGIYQDTTFNFPATSSQSVENVVLVGGENGRGKTSLLRAVAFCLYGQDAVEDYNRGGQPTIDPLVAAYKANLNGIFSHATLSSIMSVQMDIKVNENVLSIKREWKFNNRKFDGERKEVVKIWENGHSLTDGFSDIELPDQVKKIVAEQLIPYGLARFFLFDSAKVMSLADVSKKEQIKQGVDSILGVRVLQDLEKSMNKYMSERSKEAGGNESTSRIAEVNKKIDSLVKEISRLSSHILKIDGDVGNLAKEESALVDKLVKMGAENLDIGKLIKSREVESGKKKSAAEKLRETICEDFTMLAAGRSYIDSALSQMRSEKLARGWENTKKMGNKNLSAFMQKMKGKINIQPPINEGQIESLMSAMQEAWHEVWNPAPEGIPAEENYRCIPDEEMDKTIDGIASLRQKGGVEILAVYQSYWDADKALDEIEVQLGDRTSDDAKDSEKIKSDLKNIQSKKDTLMREKGSLEKEKASCESELNGQRQGLGRSLAAEKSNLPYLVKAKAAGKAIDVIEKIIDESRSQHLNQISEKMTSAFLGMAHKNDVSQIIVHDDCSVEMVREDEQNAKRGDLSHGESQIFTLALISAIVQVSGKRFPFIIDTPLGVLDVDHRRKFLDHYSSNMENQVILLSTDSEVRPKGQEMNLLRPKVACKCTIYPEGRGVVVRDGYFEE